ncbi:high-potential iron-sulfur protein [soil metagenome]
MNTTRIAPTPQETTLPVGTRRIFLLTLSVGAAGAAGFSSGAKAQAAVDEKDPQAAALGYVADASRVDAKKFPKYAAGQMCGTCALYQGKAGDANGACPLFAGKQVAAKGWCSAWAKKG